MYTVQISLQDLTLAKSLADYLTKEKLFLVTKVSKNATSALSSFMAHRPDILLIDYNLNISKDYRVIDLLSNLNFQSKNCNIFLFSNSPKNFINTATITSLKMPNSLASFKNVVKKIYNTVNNPANSFSLNKPTCEKDWENILLQLGFSITNLGTMYLSYMLSKHKRYQTLTMKNIYNDVADKFDISPDNVKWLIEKSIKNMRKNLNSTKLYTILPNYDGREITAKYLFMLLLNAYF